METCGTIQDMYEHVVENDWLSADNDGYESGSDDDETANDDFWHYRDHEVADDDLHFH